MRVFSREGQAERREHRRDVSDERLGVRPLGQTMTVKSSA
jgi:hypothetical protein